MWNPGTSWISGEGQFLAAPEDILAKPAEGEVYLHELEGFAVRSSDGSALGLVSGLYEMPAGLMLEVQGPKREFLLPFKREFVRAGRPGEPGAGGGAAGGVAWSCRCR